VRMAGYAGLVVLVDAQRIMLAENSKDGTNYYSRPAVLYAYEILREFIDRGDLLEGCLVVTIPDPAFLEGSNRGLGCYKALENRVFDEIRDRSLVNPMAALARISARPAGN